MDRASDHQDTTLRDRLSLSTLFQGKWSRTNVDDDVENGRKKKGKKRRRGEDNFPREDSLFCRICHDSSSKETLEQPCRCKGTMGFMHIRCLERWLEESNTNSCEICGFEYITAKVQKYTALRSIPVYFSTPETVLTERNLCCDTFSCMVLSPLVVLGSYMCVIASRYFHDQKSEKFGSAMWTAISLLVLMAILIFSYYLWMIMALRHHVRNWYRWYKNQFEIRIVARPDLLSEHGSSSSWFQRTFRRSPSVYYVDASISASCPAIVHGTTSDVDLISITRQRAGSDSDVTSSRTDWAARLNRITFYEEVNEVENYLAHHSSQRVLK